MSQTHSNQSKSMTQSQRKGRVGTLTTNPAIDQTVTLDHFTLGKVNRCHHMRFDAGGKGVNVALRLADYGLPVAATGFLGEQNTALFEQTFSRKAIEDRFIRTAGETRVNVKIIDVAEQQTSDINAAGVKPNDEDVQALLKTLDEMAEQCEWFILGGRLQDSLPTDLYAQMTTRLKAKNCKVILDSSGEALRLGLSAGPDVIKPNIDELSELVGKPLTGTVQVLASARALLNEQTQLVVVSMGGDGAMFVRANEALIARPPQVDIKSTVGAGDAMVAGMVAGFCQGLSLGECASLGTAFSLSAITNFVRDLPPKDVLEQWQAQVVIQPLL